MKKGDILKLCKYYKEEEKCPYPDSNSQLWWGGEKQFVNMCETDGNFFDRVRSMYLDALDKGLVTAMLADRSIDGNKRVLIFFLDLWHGKWFPYDSLDAIFDY